MGLIVLGKIEVVICLCQKYLVEIISVDLVLIYKSMNIGMVKFDECEFVFVFYCLIDIFDFSEVYLAVDFCCDVL